MILMKSRADVGRDVIFGGSEAADEKQFHLIHRDKINDGVEAGVESHAVDLLEVAEEVEPVPVHEVFIH